jgi:hypothetical protein
LIRTQTSRKHRLGPCFRFFKFILAFLSSTCLNGKKPEDKIRKHPMETYRFQVIIEPDEDGLYVADVPALQGCHTQGETFEEALDNI